MLGKGCGETMDRWEGVDTEREGTSEVASTDVEMTPDQVQSRLEETIRMFAAVRLLLCQLRERTS
jgi:hypothetical protein